MKRPSQIIFIFRASLIYCPKFTLRKKNYTKAIALYDKLIQVHPNEYSYYKVLSELHFRKRDYEAASETLQQLIQIAPFKSEELIQPIEQIIQKIPRHPVIRTLYANVYFEHLNRLRVPTNCHINQISPQ